MLVFEHDAISILIPNNARFANQVNQFIEDRTTLIHLEQEKKSPVPLPTIQSLSG
ncbi:MAG: hypothetical protein AAF572_06725 [Cyanobacteria bacterium P01_B01_bin.77]